MKVLMRKQKTPTAGASAERIRLPSIRQQMQKTSPTAGASAERISLPGARQQQSRNQAKYLQQLQLQREGVVSQEVKVKPPQQHQRHPQKIHTPMRKLWKAIHKIT